MDYEKTAIGTVIRELREKKSWSQTILADFSDISRSHLSDIENGVKSPNIATIWRIAGALGVRPSELIALAEEKVRMTDTR